MTDLYFLPVAAARPGRHVAATDPGRGGDRPGRRAAGADRGRHRGRRSDVRLLAPHHVAADRGRRDRAPLPGARRRRRRDQLLPADRVRSAGPAMALHPGRTWHRTAGSGRGWRWSSSTRAPRTSPTYGAPAPSAGSASRPKSCHQLPPADELWGWAHVQSSRPVDEVGGGGRPTIPPRCGRASSALAGCSPAARYRAALVNAFAAGADDASEPAWTSDGRHGGRPGRVRHVDVHDVGRRPATSSTL